MGTSSGAIARQYIHLLRGTATAGHVWNTSAISLVPKAGSGTSAKTAPERAAVSALRLPLLHAADPALGRSRLLRLPHFKVAISICHIRGGGLAERSLVRSRQSMCLSSGPSGIGSALLLYGMPYGRYSPLRRASRTHVAITLRLSSLVAAASGLAYNSHLPSSRIVFALLWPPAHG
ncbi:hypothetical protein CCMA1212_005604 [Trichoderma ghanense]|uniref:Uncharacterized protein n=1 Tax=Trichoderma ghanense TaxID=65468 RepID=A0ABY2H271_9HYPO